MKNIISLGIKSRFGSKKGLIRSIFYNATEAFGAFSQYKNIDFKSVERVIFICAGNICRSPLAEAVAKKEGKPTDSYGLNCRGGDDADLRAIRFALENGLDLSAHKTKNIKQYQPQKGDLVIGMEPKHTKELHSLFGDSQAQLTLAGLWLAKPKAYIHDPFNTNELFFDQCEAQVIEATLALLKRLES